MLDHLWTNLPISLADFSLEPDLLKAPTMLKEIIQQIEHKEEMYQLHLRYVNVDTLKNLFSTIIK